MDKKIEKLEATITHEDGKYKTDYKVDGCEGSASGNLKSVISTLEIMLKPRNYGKLKLYKLGGPSSTGYHERQWKDIYRLMVQVIMCEQEYERASSSYYWIKDEMYIALNVDGCNDWMYRNDDKIRKLQKQLINEVIPKEIEVITEFVVPNIASDEGRWFDIALSIFSSREHRLKSIKDSITETLKRL